MQGPDNRVTEPDSKSNPQEQDAPKTAPQNVLKLLHVLNPSRKGYDIGLHAHIYLALAFP